MSSQHEMQASNRGPAVDGAGQRSLAGPQVREGTAQARQPRPLIAALAAAGILGPVVFAVAAVVQGLLRPGYSFVANPVVALVAGPSGWVQDLNFVVLGAAMIAFAIGLQLGVRPTRWAPWWGLFNWSALTLWLTCTVVLARRLLRVARATPRRSRAMTTEPEGQAAQPSTTG